MKSYHLKGILNNNLYAFRLQLSRLDIYFKDTEFISSRRIEQYSVCLLYTSVLTLGCFKSLQITTRRPTNLAFK